MNVQQFVGILNHLYLIINALATSVKMKTVKNIAFSQVQILSNKRKHLLVFTRLKRSFINISYLKWEERRY